MDFYHYIRSGRVFGLGAEISTGINMFGSRIFALSLTILWWEISFGLEVY